MASPVDSLEPRYVWKFFGELAQVPRPSKREDQAVEWLVKTGRALGCEVELQEIQPGAGRPFYANTLLRKPATPGREASPVTALQAHIDMVGVRADGVQHDFSKDPIALRVLGDEVRATGTTLGADNGIGLCAALAALADPDVSHGPLEVLITVDEEAGMTGARNLKHGWLKAKYLLNLDSEEDGEATISCAGGMDTIGERPLALEAAPTGWQAWTLELNKLPGGHSGLQIHEGRANAIRVLAEILQTLEKVTPLRISTLAGGSARNAIPDKARATFLAAPEGAAALQARVAGLEGELRARLSPLFETNGALQLRLSAADPAPALVMSQAEAALLLNLLQTLPHGVKTMSPAVPGLVQTSTNLALLKTENGKVQIDFLSRSSVDPEKHALGDELAALLGAAGFTCRTGNEYPGWKPVPDSDIVALLKQAHVEALGAELKIIACHAGLECGLIGDASPGLQMVSFGPTIKGAHTPDEHTFVSSVAQFWKVLKAVLEKV